MHVCAELQAAVRTPLIRLIRGKVVEDDNDKGFVKKGQFGEHLMKITKATPEA